MKRLTVLLLFVLSVSASLFATEQKAIVKGFVHDKSTNEVLEYATVMVYAQSDNSLVGGAITDMRGHFEVILDYGTYTFSIQFMGFKQRELKNVAVNKENVALGKIYLEPDVEMLDEVEVRAERSNMEMTLDRRVFNVGKDLTSTSNNAIELLENIPSVTVDVDGNVSLRGDEGVQILIDGKESGLVGMSTQDALNTLQADMVDRVEIITNPSVRYDAEGTAGIINIVLKKDKRRGFNGNVDLRVGHPWQAGISASANYRINKFNFFGNFSRNYRHHTNGSYVDTKYFDGEYDDYAAGLIEPDKYSYQTTERTSLRNGHTFRAGAEYSINEKSSLSLSAMVRFSQGHNNPLVQYFDSIPGMPMQYSTRAEDWYSSRPMQEYTLNYIKNFSGQGHKLTAEARFFTNREDEWSTINEYAFGSTAMTDTLSRLEQGTDVRESMSNIQLTVDYERPVGRNGKFEAGAKYTDRTIAKTNLITQDETFLRDLSYDFNYVERLGATYLIYGNDYGRFSYQAGLRAEYTFVNPQLVDTLGIFEPTQTQNYLNFFPSGHINYKLSEQDQLQLSYTRRIRRPRYHQLNPFNSFNDNRNLRMGNPNLKPVFTDSYEVSYMHFGDKGSTSLTAYYRHSENTMRRYTWVDSLTGISYTKPLNFGTENSFGLEFTANLQLYKWWNINGNFNFFRSIVDGTIDGNDYRTDSYNIGGRFVSKFSFKRICDLQLTANFHGPHDEPLGHHDGEWWLDVAANRDVLHGQGTLTLSIRDLFETRGHGGESWGYGFDQYSWNTWTHRTINLSLNYRINQQKKNRRQNSEQMMDESEFDE